MRRSFIAGLAPILLGLATAAKAADLPPHPQPYPEAPILRPSIDWTGAYAGVQIGYAVGDDITREFLTSTWTFIGLENRFQPSGWLGGVHAGYNMQWGQIVLGVEADAEFGRVSGGFVDPPEPPFNPGGRGRTELELQGSIRGRVGYAFDRLIIYGTGGVAMGQLSSTYTNWAGTSEAFRKPLVGYTLGAGIEYALTPSITLRGEYRFTKYNLIKNHSTVAFPGFSGTQEPEYSALRTGMSYRF